MYKSILTLFALISFQMLDGQNLSHPFQDARIKSIGIPNITNYTPKDYSSKQVVYGSQNFNALIGDDGKMYFANIEGLLIFDGVNWMRYRLPGRAAVYSLVKAPDGMIYVGGANEIGYLTTNQTGALEYISLRPKLGEIANEHFTARKGFMVKDQVVFLDDNHVLIFDHRSKDFKSIPTPEANRTVVISQEEFYSYRKEGQYKLNFGGWEKIRNTDLNVSENGGRIVALDLPDGTTLIVKKDGFFDFQTEKRIRINRDVKQILSNSSINSATLLNNKYLALCTSQGLLITDFNGEPVQFLNQKKGLTDNVTFDIALDRSGLLWTGTNTGIDAIEIFSPFTVFDERSGINGNVSFMEKLNDEIYLACASGTYKTRWEQLFDPISPIPFQKLDPDESRMILSNSNELISLGSKGTMILENGSFRKVKGTGKDRYWVGMKYKDSEDIMLASDEGKLLHLTKQTGDWQIKKELQGPFKTVRFMVQGLNEELWICNRNEVFKLEYDKASSKIILAKKYDSSHGLPFDVDNYVFDIGGRPTFSTYSGIYQYDASTDRFMKDDRFLSTVGDMPLLRISEDKEGNIFCLSDGYLVLRKTSSGFKMTRILNEKLIDYNPFHANPIDSANVLLPTYNAFVHVDPTIPLDQSDFDVKITSAREIGSEDSIYYSGFGKLPRPQLPPTNNAIRIEFAAAYYQNIDWIQYKWRLKGFDDRWSDWSAETSKDYTNLPYGDYTFEVVAKNIVFVESKSTSFQFTIATPWYLTYWAYGFCASMVGFFIWGIVKLNTRRLQKDKERLEKIVDERTQEISRQKEKVEKDAGIISEQHNKLLQMDELKSRFFINISHELRTPLTLIMGTMDRALKGTYGSASDELYDNMKVVNRNSERLMKMVSNILDISKLEGGKMQLYASKTRITDALSRVIAFFTSRFQDREITLKSDIESSVEVYLDTDKLDTILINLIANAFKFTPNKGNISVSLSEENDRVHIHIKDDGSGIPAEDIPFIFDRFYQSPHVKSGEGLGVGLALTKELVELHQGTISVVSDTTSGTEFTVTFLKGNEHLRPTQILDPADQPESSVLEEKYPLTDNQRSKGIKLSNREPVPANNNKPHILMVEDNYEMRDFIRQLLSNNYRVSEVENGQEGLDFLKKQKPDLILTDYLMPIMDGYEMATEIKKSDELAYLPIIFLTARIQERDKIDVLNLGVDDYLFKPFNAEELQVRINNLLNAKKQRSAFLIQKSIDPRDIEWKDFPSKLKLDVDQFIKEHIKEEITGESLADYTKQSERSLYRKIKVNTGLSLMQYIKEYRLRYARTLLENKEVQTVSEAAYAVGFNYLSHFTKNYKERFGRQPSKYLD